ncbi:MAG: FecR domain-containing protein [Myxococcota bacterium]|nr:FecR domain-containing protein [Myxococcota bacterium]
MREQIQTLLAAMLVLIAGLVGYTLLFSDSDEIGLSVVSTSGVVVRTDKDGLQESATPGMRLLPKDELTVGAQGAAELAVDEQTRMTLSSASSIRVVGVDAGGVRIELEEGRVTARVRPESPALSITSRGRGVSATDAEFDVVAGADGALGVEGRRGELSLQGFDDVSSLPEGTRLSVAPGLPAQAAPIPASLLLEVAWPEHTVTRDAAVALQGQTSPYASVSLLSADQQPTTIRAGADGRFSTALPLQEGDNTIEVMVEDVMGNRERATWEIQRDTEAPSVNTEVLWGN